MDEELHVLAVDDNLIDRKLVERILKISSCKGKLYHFLLAFKILEPRLPLKCNNWFFFAVTTAENGLRALEYLGLGDPQQTESLTTNSVSLTF